MGKAINGHLQEVPGQLHDHLVFSSTLTTALHCLSQAMRNQLQYFSDTLIVFFDGKKLGLIMSCNGISATTQALTPVLAATTNG